MSNTIHVAYALDDNYTEFTCVSMTSLLHNTNRPVHFHVLENRLSEENKRILRDIGKRYPHGQWTFYHVGSNDGFVCDDAKKLTIETYFRLYLPKLLIDIDKVLWIDSDTIINGDIIDLYETELNDKLAGVVADSLFGNDTEHRKVLNLGEYYYFNAGVMLFNLSALRRGFDLLNKCTAISKILYAKKTRKRLSYCADQEALNYILKGKVEYLPWKYNFMFHFEMNEITQTHTLHNSVEAFSNPVIIHYIGSFLKKIAKLNGEYISNPFWELFYKYKKLTVFRDDEADGKKIINYNKRVQLLDNAILVVTELLRVKRYSLFNGTADLIREKIGHRKLAIWGFNNYTCLLIVLLSVNGILVSAVVDGLLENQLEEVFDLVTEPPTVLNGKRQEYFILFDMCDNIVADNVKMIAREYGYTDSDYYYVYEPIYRLFE
jgi:lipopolysaccharide biosynthesis glycosyltransferase